MQSDVHVLSLRWMIRLLLLCGGGMRAVRGRLLVLIRCLLRIRAAVSLGRLRGDRISGGLRLLLVVRGVIRLLLCLGWLLLVDLRRVLVLVRVLGILLLAWLLRCVHGRILLPFHLHVADVAAAASALLLVVHAECVAVVDKCGDEEKPEAHRELALEVLDWRR